MFFLCGKYIPMYKRFLYSQHVHTVFKKHDLEKGETALMEGLRALTHSGLPLSQTSPILRRREKLPQAHALYICCSALVLDRLHLSHI